jgi:mannose-6-phosphate isomerase-like protein (cupin superfamily)
MAQDAIIVAAGEGKPIEIAMGPLRVKVSGEDSDGRIAVMELEVPPGLGPAAHLHRGCDETFYVLSGTFRFAVGDRTVAASTGTLVFIPRGTPHGLRNVGTETGRLLAIVNPAGLEKFFEEVGPMPYGPERAALGLKYGVEPVDF